MKAMRVPVEEGDVIRNLITRCCRACDLFLKEKRGKRKSKGNFTAKLVDTIIAGIKLALECFPRIIILYYKFQA